MSDPARVRRRKSYKFFAEEAKFFGKRPKLAEVLNHLYALLNGRWAYGSATNASYARESLMTFIRDRKL